jgi:hypothetical protein
MEEDLRTQAARPRTFTNSDNMVEMIRRGNGLRDLASKQAVEHAIMTGRGNVDLLLTPKQYERLVRSRWPILRSIGCLPGEFFGVFRV